MSAYRIASNLREVRLISVGVNRGMRKMLMVMARVSSGSLRATHAKEARSINRDLVRELRAARTL